jgi:hypothetical protein
MSPGPIRLIRYERLVTPAEHLEVLVEPPFPALGVATGGTLRTALREQLHLRSPVILTGHQAEFFHAGVFAKLIAAHELARRTGGQAVFLTVDSDVPKAQQLIVPQLAARGVRRVEVPIPGIDPQHAFEAQPRMSRAAWLQFFASVTSLCQWHDRSLLPVFARGWLTTEEPEPSFCDALWRAHAAAAGALGLDGIHELRMSQLCQTPAFRTFAATILLDPRRCAQFYNAAQTAYRQRHRVRSRGRPVPPLAVHENAVEVPLWVLRAGQPRRRLFAAPHGDRVDLVAEGHVIGALSRSELADGGPWALEREGWQFRPRALALSGFARLFLADLFIHGIGGAKYDEMMEEFAEPLVRASPLLGGASLAPAGCVSATLHLPLPHSNIRAADVAAARQRARDLRHNPQRHLPNAPEPLVSERARLVRRALELREHAPHEHDSRRATFTAIRHVNQRMLETDPWRAAQYDEHARTVETQWQLDRLALDREYFYALHPRESLVELVGRVGQALGHSPGQSQVIGPFPQVRDPSPGPEAGA